MLRRGAMIASLLGVVLLATGCALFRHLDNSTPEEMRKFSSTKEELWHQTRVLEQEALIYRQRLAVQQTEANRINGELSHWQGQAARADARAQALQKEVSLLEGRWRQGQEPPAPVIANLPPPALPQAPVRKRPLKIKVLAGDGKSGSAAGLAKRLAKLDYQVARIDRAPRADFPVNTVFFAAGCEEEATRVAGQLGKGTVSKPLSWPSVFDLIIVTGLSS